MIFDEWRTVDTVAEIIKGLSHYFDIALPTVLLYKNERQQYKEVIVDNLSPSRVYGAEHLLRLFGIHIAYICRKLWFPTAMAWWSYLIMDN